MPTRHPLRLLAASAATAAAVLGLTGCTTQATRCSGGTCTVNLSGAQTLDVDPRDDWELPMQVGPIEPAAVTVSVSGAAARLVPGATTDVAGVRVQLLSVAGRDVSLRYARA